MTSYSSPLTMFRAKKMRELKRCIDSLLYTDNIIRYLSASTKVLLSYSFCFVIIATIQALKSAFNAMYPKFSMMLPTMLMTNVYSFT